MRMTGAPDDVVRARKARATSGRLVSASADGGIGRIIVGLPPTVPILIVPDSFNVSDAIVVCQKELRLSYNTGR